MNRDLKIFQMVGYAEGLSFILLLFIAMPLKYIWNTPEWVQIIGAAHGALFLLYIGMATYVAFQMNWPRKILLLSYIASTVPFGPFLFDRKILRYLEPGTHCATES